MFCRRTCSFVGKCFYREVSTVSLYGNAGVKKLESFIMANVLWALRKGGNGKIVNSMPVTLLCGQKASYVCTNKQSEVIGTDRQEMKQRSIVTGRAEH